MEQHRSKPTPPTFEQLIPGNPKVIGAAKALVETMEETEETPEDDHR